MYLLNSEILTVCIVNRFKSLGRLGFEIYVVVQIYTRLGSRNCMPRWVIHKTRGQNFGDF